MAKRIDKASWVGRKIGSLTIVGLGADARFFRCECDCGRSCLVRVYNLTKTKPQLSCGCKAKENRSRAAKESIKRNGRIVHEVSRKLKTNLKVTSTNRESNNSSGIRGVSRTANGKFQAEIAAQGKRYYLGVYSTLEAATKARVKAEGLVFGSLTEDISSIIEDFRKNNK